ncbi:glycosyl transferase, group 1 family protein [Coleofasciculus chthonoplastes PCC 7420]|uniref:Glycosyl transferase, group 1 family protein n=1 Tax=Coleofasciculus chthonoplastes PCC 7420 TaxID=118168 RepID=B4VH31_9CYAN|nr:glycosyltransferase [Coleofasciculus chthonoplastes]EDX78642.1 glycosyl transferase, group 1 family protein [Coleofasciculus chthonoplastes PCC 7420]
MKYALVHEWLTPNATGGSERVVREILKSVEADLYALIDFESTNPHSYLFERRIGTTFLQHFPLASKGVQKYLPLLPLAIEQLDLRDYDVILSSSHAVAKGVLTRPQQLHICYCHTPMRYAWDLTFDYLNSSAMGRGFPGSITRYLLHRLRQWDVISANRVDYFIANSRHTARRIWRCYRREAQVIYPPVHTERFSFQAQKSDFYLTVSRLVSYKQVTLIVEAFNQLGYPLVVIGEGSQLQALRHLAKPNVQVLGFCPDRVVEEYMAQAKAFVYAACEDFGIALVEAQACGTPVIAYGAGGALETVRDIRKHPDKGTGLFFLDQSPQALMEAVKAFEARATAFSPEQIQLNAAQFAPTVFSDRYLTFLDGCYRDHLSRC